MRVFLYTRHFFYAGQIDFETGRRPEDPAPIHPPRLQDILNNPGIFFFREAEHGHQVLLQNAEYRPLLCKDARQTAAQHILIDPGAIEFIYEEDDGAPNGETFNYEKSMGDRLSRRIEILTRGCRRLEGTIRNGVTRLMIHPEPERRFLALTDVTVDLLLPHTEPVKIPVVLLNQNHVEAFRALEQE